MKKEQFFKDIEEYISPKDIIKIKVAYTLAKFGHRFQFRKEIENNKQVRYFEHPKRVALVLIKELCVYNADEICIALLHDVFEDTKDITPELVEYVFGTYVCNSIQHLTKTNKNTYIQKLNQASKAVKTIKLCDRVDNMRHINSDLCTPEFKEKKIKETKEKYLPIFYSIKDSHNKALIEELEKICNDFYSSQENAS